MPFKNAPQKVEARLPRACGSRCAAILAVLGVMSLCLIPPPSWGAMEGQDKVRSFFAVGQAITHETDFASSRQNAVQNMQMQAVTQASGALLSPSLPGFRLEKMYHEIFSRPEKFVQNYQVFWEDPSEEGLYRVAGTVTVSLDLLHSDLVRLGFFENGSLAPAGEEESLHSAVPDREESLEKIEKTGLDGPMEPGVMEIRVISSQSYVRWLEIEELLRKTAPDLALRSLELGREKTVVRILGLEEEMVSRLNGLSMEGGRLLRVESLHPEGMGFRLTFEQETSQDGFSPADELTNGKMETEGAP